MLISNFNLYKSEWLDLVFDKRNKEYGAYNIRQHYAENLSKALFIAVVTIVGGTLAVGAAIKVEPAEKVVVVDLPVLPPPPSSQTKEEPVKPELEQPAKATTPVKTKGFPPPVVTNEPVDTEPPTIDELKDAAVGQVDIAGPSTTQGANPEPVTTTSGGGGTGTDITESSEPVNTAVLSVMPAPVGGDEVWTKFLKKNLRYPALAVEEGKGGKVWISFVIEKDGTLTDIKVVRGPGFGMDEEALRVLKKAPAWTPGIQHNKPVRVQYTLPINFALE
ncbi:energy transducer TonB [Mucilaginibacter auburnensis]|uniref:Protein TonB n=1 Tax=Mucilaginibacter auburnensis TaxID=1457233 RepID=A0A2H9VMN1_9SPHI|nr:energy transducer TonB [Mucilaginibacter auburnensis]PJJ79563.1 protein TonB [Mucilaginibacter auburnensis]